MENFNPFAVLCAIKTAAQTYQRNVQLMAEIREAVAIASDELWKAKQATALPQDGYDIHSMEIGARFRKRES